ncbi:enolase C-terminal domain-like protein [Streptomyces sp. NPDC058457]|uniref:enolase C-terminal domain-like protein n=1 Tax=Streptomyces sp. NPDC058457 TaxID=3346507 RepID=UPI0036698E8D
MSSHERGWTTSAVEVACPDARGRLLGRPVSGLCGGRVRGTGGGVPRAAAAAPLRLDPNTAWTVETSGCATRELEGVLECPEDPAATVESMAAVAKESRLQLATDMRVIAWEYLRPTVGRNAIRALLTDHHDWGGLRRTRELAAACEAFGPALAISMHSNSRLGISLAAMTQVAAAIPNLDRSCDTHYLWKCADDVIRPGGVELADRAVRAPPVPRLGVELDHEALDRQHRQHRQHRQSGMRTRDDTGYLRRVDPTYELGLPRW